MAPMVTPKTTKSTHWAALYRSFTRVPIVPPTTTTTTSTRMAHRTTSTALRRAMAASHGPRAVTDRLTYGQIFFGFLPIPNVFGSAEVNSSTDGLNSEHSPYLSQAIGPLMPANLIENTASRNAFLPI